MTHEEDLRRYISDNTGIPETLLDGNTEAEIIARARNILAYKDASTPYPVVYDGGEVIPGSFRQSTRDQFAEFARDALAYDPFRNR